MTIKDKIFRLDSQFEKDLPKAGEAIDSIYISGYASVNTPDRDSDVVPSSVWEAGLQNFLKNPIVLAYHDHSQPVGRVVEHKVDSKGLWVKVRISASAEDVFNLVKDGVVTAFSVSFRVLDAEYNSVTELFVIKELELIELSVVSVPCHQDTLFSLSKSFENDVDFKLFKSQFVKSNDSAKEQELTKKTKSTTLKEIGMDPKELEALLAKAASDAAEVATQKMLKAQADAEAAKQKKIDEDAAIEKRVQELVAKALPKTEGTVTTGPTGAETLLADIEKRFKESEEKSKSVLAGLEASIKEKAVELEAIQKSKMSFADKNGEGAVTYAEKEKAVMLGRLMNKSVSDTKYGKNLLEKAGAHVASATWELEVSLNMEAEMRRRLVVANIMSPIQMQTNVMTIPVNPEAGFATWITNAQFGTTASPGAAQTHQLKEITLNAYKVATMEYMAYEEEEDSLLLLLPIVKDAMVRRVAKAVDKAFLLGAGSGADPVKGFAIYDATSAVVATNTGAATIANLRSLRQDLGAWGLTQGELIYIVSTDIYYNLLDDTTFQTMDKVGPNATLLTGQIGMIGQTPVLVSDQFPTKAGGAATATTNIGAICVAKANFIAGNQRGLRIDTQDLVETQRRVWVASLRTGMTQLSTVNGVGVSTFRWS